MEKSLCNFLQKKKEKENYEPPMNVKEKKIKKKKKDEAPAKLLMKGYCANRNPRFCRLDKINKPKTPQKK